ncbi:MAG: hypothetical protein R3B06_18405 [Kofleriaceae bacterium]
MTRVAAAVAAAAWAACSAAAPPADLTAGYARARAGDVDGALAAFRAAGARCADAPSRHPTPPDCARALLAEAALLADDGRTAEAIAAYEAIDARTHGDPAPSAEAWFQAGRLAYQADQVDRAARDLWRVIDGYPDEAFAGDAVDFIVRRARADAPRAVWARLRDAYQRLSDTDVADNLLWALADLAAHELAEPATAIELYDRIPIDHPTSGLRDDARWRAAQLARAHGDPAGAVRRLRGLLATREVAFGTGSYFSVWLDDAQLALGRILRDDLHDTAGAEVAFARLPRDYPRSILVDDALAELAATQEQRGDRAGACASARRLITVEPASRFVAAARDRVARLGCPEAGR